MSGWTIFFLDRISTLLAIFCAMTWIVAIGCTWIAVYAWLEDGKAGKERAARVGKGARKALKKFIIMAIVMTILALLFPNKDAIMMITSEHSKVTTLEKNDN